MKFTPLQILALINTILSAALAMLSFVVYFSGASSNSRCEFCSIMLVPALIFLMFLMFGLYSIFSNQANPNLKKRPMLILNAIAIGIGLSAILFNLLA